MPSPLQVVTNRLQSLSRPSRNGEETRFTKVTRTVPMDIILEIAQRLTSLGALLDFGLISRSTYHILLPTLYAHVQLDSNDQCRATLSYLAREPDVAIFVKSLVVRPNHRIWDSNAHQEEQDEAWIADLVSLIAAQGKFRLLESFHWDGMEVPKDRLWLKLRSFCPRLRHIGCSVGQNPLHGESELFKFVNLAGFSLTSHTCNFRHHRSFHQVTPEETDLPDSLWTMLLENSPQLERLVLNGRQDHLWRISRVSEGRWPAMRKLSLGYHAGGINNHPPFREFLSVHPLLRDITLTGLRFEPWDVSEETSLLDVPAVEVYTGFWPIHRSTISYPMYKSIKSVTAYHVMWIPSSWMMTTVFPTLKKKLPSLTSLSMSVEFRSRVGVTTLDFFRSLFSSCPSLTHLELLSSSHFDLEDFATALEDAPSLATFTLVKVPKLASEDLTRSAVRLLRHKPSLRSFTIAHVCPWRRSEEFLVKHKGIYEMIPGPGGIPSSIFVSETAHKRGQRQTRRYRLDLSDVATS
ncbi:hypothetical protein PC9H_008213 [Pleurotus ostreatus]|uniref:Uncharacterized protein n=1 Tax=Pleurotus ostreatus TaxID=5322 RepID=A0A8H6ZV04_PLEOS|nr:uncharacterized protein PC9H_008213 [Pleurotus ostreatus]KAF7428976.1 hypothetical protein PC9H_008213 [Pleurotus ostreatus]KAJ8697248.1 hypothetical protein PTI98_007045 [Pleurotus ostreatus]